MTELEKTPRPDVLNKEPDIRDWGNVEFTPSARKKMEGRRDENNSLIPDLLSFETLSRVERDAVLSLELNEIFDDPEFTTDIMKTKSLGEQFINYQRRLGRGGERNYPEKFDRNIAGTLKRIRSGEYHDISDEEKKLLLVKKVAVFLADTYNDRRMYGGDMFENFSEEDVERIKNVEEWVASYTEQRLGDWIPDWFKEESDACGFSDEETIFLKLDIWDSPEDSLFTTTTFRYEDINSYNPYLSRTMHYDRRTFRTSANLRIYNSKSEYGELDLGIHFTKLDSSEDKEDSEISRNIYIRHKNESNNRVTWIDLSTTGDSPYEVVIKSGGEREEYSNKTGNMDEGKDRLDKYLTESFGIGVEEFIEKISVNTGKLSKDFINAKKPNHFESSTEALNAVLDELSL